MKLPVVSGLRPVILRTRRAKRARMRRSSSEGVVLGVVLVVVMAVRFSSGAG